MANRGKKYTTAKKAVSESNVSVHQAIKSVVDLAFAKFDETLSVDVSLGIDPTKGDQVVRSSSMLPNGTGKKVVVVAFVKGSYEDQAKQAGADFVGYEDLIDKVLAGWTEFDYAVTTPDFAAGLSKLAKALGPKGLLPNKKTGTVTFDIGSIVADLKKGRVSFRNDKGAGVHVGLGKLSFGVEKLEENYHAFMKSLIASKPSTAKGRFIRKVVVASTQGVGVKVSLDEGYLI